MSVNLTKNRDSILAAWNDVLNEKTATNWALFGYEGQTNDLCFISSGDGGIDELQGDLNSGKIMYAFLKVLDPKTSLPKCVLINWTGEGAPMVRKGTCANHIRDVGNLLKGAHVTINARTEEDVDEEIIINKVSKSTGSAYSFKERSVEVDKQIGPVGTTYKRVIPSKEINSVERDMFWQKEEEEEKKRQAEERRKREEARKQLELERRLRESEENAERDTEKENDVNQSKSESAQKEAEALIKMRNFDARAIFERNTSAGQLNNRRGSSHKAEPAIVVSPTREEHQSANSNKVNWPPQQNEVKVEPAVIKNEPKVEVIQKPQEPPNAEVTQPKLEPVAALISQNIVDQTDPVVADFPIYDDVNYENGNALLDDYEGLGLRAQALYDYQAADETEISFDPGDIITHIDPIDSGWWQGLAPDGTYGLFPANYVQMID